MLDGKGISKQFIRISFRRLDGMQKNNRKYIFVGRKARLKVLVHKRHFILPIACTWTGK